MSTSGCPNKELCGSCSWSHLPYEEQCQQKLREVNSALELNKLPYRVEEVVPSPRLAHYRNRMDFVIDFEGRVGLRQKGKWWRVIDDHRCFISDERIEELFTVVRNWVRQAELSYFDRKKHTGLLRFALIRASLAGETLVDIITSEPAPGEREALLGKLSELAKDERITTLLWSSNPTIADVSNGNVQQVVKGTGFLHEEVRGLRFRVSPHAFFQTNSHTAGLLIDTVRGWAKAAGSQRLLDLYCGTGFFAISLAGHCSQVFGVEVVPEAIVDARFNAEANGVQVQFEVAPSEDYDWSSHQIDTVIVDPPRGGMHERTLAQLRRLVPSRVFYVSCNYKHFAKDLATLSDLYEPRTMLLIDQFPHTPHVELIAWLDRKSDARAV